MIKSMTGFGRAEVADASRKFTVEIKSVNHRYLDVNIKLPKTLNFFESAIRSLLKEYIERGKVDVFISYEDYTEENYSLKYNAGLAEQYMTYLKEMAEQFGIENDVRVSTLSRYPDVFVMEEQSPDEQKLWAGLEQALRQAAAQFVESRIKEGERLMADLVEKLDGMISYVDYIEERSPQVLEEYRMRLESKVQELLGDRQLDDARIAAEITIFADKICVDEETVRLRSHILSMKETLLAGGGMGRKLDFIAQEMNREANTILSKTTDLKVSDVGINLKTDIEKVREQIQNIEWVASMAGLINIGFGNMVNTDKIISIISSDSAPAKRLIQRGKETETLIDATQGRRTKSVIFTENNKIILSALQPETLAGRFNGNTAEDYDDAKE